MRNIGYFNKTSTPIANSYYAGAYISRPSVRLAQFTYKGNLQ
jgi:hypothetical protein